MIPKKINKNKLIIVFICSKVNISIRYFYKTPKNALAKASHISLKDNFWEDSGKLWEIDFIQYWKVSIKSKNWLFWLMDTIYGYIYWFFKKKKINCTNSKIYVHLYKYTTNVISIKFVQIYGTYEALKII